MDKHDLDSVAQDIADLSVFQVLVPDSILGLVVHCDDCDADHYHRWKELLAALIQLSAGRDAPTATHNSQGENELFVTWDWCRGYAAAKLHDHDRFLRS